MKEVDLLGVQLVRRQRSMIHIRKKRTDGVMFNRKIVNHRALPLPITPGFRNAVAPGGNRKCNDSIAYGEVARGTTINHQ